MKYLRGSSHIYQIFGESLIVVLMPSHTHFILYGEQFLMLFELYLAGPHNSTHHHIVVSLYWKIYIFQMKIAKRFSESIRRCSLLSRWNICFSFQITLTIASKFVCAAAKRRQSDLNLLNVPPGAPTAPRWSSSPQSHLVTNWKHFFHVLFCGCGVERGRASEWVT